MKIFKNEFVQMDINAIDVLQKQINKFDMQVGVFDNIPRRKAVSGMNKTFAGGPVRKAVSSTKPTMSGELAADLEIRYRWLSNPFIKSASTQTKDTINFTDYFLRSIVKGDRSASSLRRIANLLQAIVRNPITRGEYGSNSSEYAKIKGFNRLLFDTGQFFKSIIAKVK